MVLQKIDEIFENSQNSKIALFIRHGEKSGSSMGLLSESGKIAVKSFANNLKKLGCPVNIISSPELRCVQTSNIINEIISHNENDIILSNKLGYPGLHISNSTIYQQLYQRKKAREIFYEWEKGLHFDCLRTPQDLRKLSMEFIRRSCAENGITIFISQSGTVSGIGYSLGLLDFNVADGEWIDYLDGFYMDLTNIE